MSIDGPAAQQLSGYGLYPGIVITVCQSFPSYVVKADETEVALEGSVAARIKVSPL